ncbi:MAG: response regulator [Cyanobacteria bacterium P01_F01_bin.13]
MRLLLIDDDEALMETLGERLIKQRYAVDIATTGEMAQEFLDLFTYDLIVLDMLLPDIDGISLCQTLRRHDINCPLMMLTAKDNSHDKVRALDAGADDYVLKPFDFEELCARIRALLRRDSQGAISALQWGELTVYPETFEVRYGEHLLHTTPKEYALLELFLRHPNRVFSLDAIIDNLWSFEDPPSGDAVRTHIKGVRQKLKAGGAPKDFIETVYGLGYRLKALETVDEAPEQTSVAQAPTQADMAVAVAKAWETHQDTMQERLSILEATAAALDGGQLSSELQHAGCSQAHKLAGSLGCFGFAEGSRIARKLERLLEVPLDNQDASQVTGLVKGLRQNLTTGETSQTLVQTLASQMAVAPSGTPYMLIGGADGAMAQELTSAGLAAGLRSVVVPDLSQVECRFQEQSADGLVLGISDRTFSAALPLLDILTAGSDHLPVIVMTDIQDFRQRLELVQRGVDRILPTATPSQHVIKDLHDLLQADRRAFKVMIVDDDVQVLDFLTTALSPWGFQLTTLDSPEQLLSTLETVRPHLLVLDVEMPGVNGLELCQVLRADDRWQHLPVLFLTVHEDTQTKQDAFKVGADDFISKSVMVTDLPMRILSRLKRSQA